MGTRDDRTALRLAALALTSPSTTAAELGARFGEAGASVEPAVADALLAELAGMGLVRVSRGTAGHRRFVPTSLGQRLIDGGLHPATTESLEELEQLRTDLLATIAHELRTPLTAVRTSVGLLLDPASSPSDEQRQALLLAIERNADRMQRVVGDILELSRFRSGNVALQLRRFDAAALAEVAVTTVAPLAERQRQRITLTSSVAHGHQVYGDRRRLEQALVNLVANAHRFSDDGAEIRVRVEAPDRHHTAWVVEDDGPGIPDVDRARLFERFFVGRSDRTGPREGVGLGLPTALAIAQAHGGTIDVESSVGEGSRFTLVVPDAGPEDDS